MVARREPLTPDDALRVARWRLDAGEQVPTGLLIDAARAANLSGDPELGAQLAGLALDEGAGLTATLLLARANVVRNRFAEAEAVLAAAEPVAPGDPEALPYIGQRVHALYWGLRRLAEARALLARAERWSQDEDMAAPAGSVAIGVIRVCRRRGGLRARGGSRPSGSSPTRASSDASVCRWSSCTPSG